ncbi:MAG: class I SAM-dependent RNA methyltransferase [Rubricella sp.]
MGIVIERLGHRGDGIAPAPEGDRYIPFTLPGEVVEETGGRPRILTSSSDRVKPRCPAFTRCGGCALQHASDAFVARWREEIVAQALAARGIEARFAAQAISPPRSRRRATFSARRTKKGVQFGFHAGRGEEIVEIAACTVLHPDLLALVGPLGDLARIGGSRKGELKIAVTLTDSGADMSVTGGKPLEGAMLPELVAFCHRARLARLSWEGEVVATLTPPAVAMGRARVEPPPGAFLQATAEGEAALVAAVATILTGGSRLLDLFAGCGTFALALSERAEVHAVEGEAPMLAALDRGWRGASGVKRVTTETRDLFRRPVLASEMMGFDGAVIDPPRAGAERQVAELAAARLPRIAMVSCNPVTFARDAEALIQAGYAMGAITVVDQFRWSPHTELVAGFTL